MELRVISMAPTAFSVSYDLGFLRLCSMRGKTIRSSDSSRTEKQIPKQETLMKGNIIHRRPTQQTRYHIYHYFYRNTTNKKKIVVLQIEKLKIVSCSKLIHK